MRSVVVVALTTERGSATLHTAVIANCRSAISAFSHGGLATRHTYVVISEFNLTELVHGKLVEYQYSTMQSSQPTGPITARRCVAWTLPFADHRLSLEVGHAPEQQ